MDNQPTIIRLTESYGSERLQQGEWFVPAGESVVPTVVLVHGGFWRKQYDRHLEDKVATDLAERGYLCWNLDYRSSAVPWPATLTDVAKGYDHLTAGRFADRVDRHRVAASGTPPAASWSRGWPPATSCDRTRPATTPTRSPPPLRSPRPGSWRSPSPRSRTSAAARHKL
jgi:hypothetical protein